jgi:predicted metal-dependent HD superfamily phosphohydrolase
VGIAAAGLYESLVAAYGQPSRHYHDLDHVAECLLELDAMREQARWPDAVELGLFYHDVVYDTRRSDNEEQSAAFAAAALTPAGNRLVSVVRGLVLATRHALAPQDDDQALIMDIDLAILGSPEQVFDRYEAAIRQEYAWVPEPLFRTKRAEILRDFLARPSLYHTTSFRERLEQRARANLARSIARLSTGFPSVPAGIT